MRVRRLLMSGVLVLAMGLLTGHAEVAARAATTPRPDAGGLSARTGFEQCFARTWRSTAASANCPRAPPPAGALCSR
jgi:hypothetical protein